MDNDFAMFLLGIVVTFCFVIIIFIKTDTLISDEELYRFCIVRKIPLQDCKIPPFPLPKDYKGQ